MGVVLNKESRWLPMIVFGIMVFGKTYFSNFIYNQKVGKYTYPDGEGTYEVFIRDHN